LFRIDRSLVNVSSQVIKNFVPKDDVDDNVDGKGEVDIDLDFFDFDAGQHDIDKTISLYLDPDEESELEPEPEFEPGPDPAELAEEMFAKYLSEAEQELQERAEAVINDAKAEAAQILIETRDEIEEEKNRGFQEGYAEGAAEGKQSYDEQTKAKIEADDEVLKNVLDELYREQERLIENAEAGTVELAIEIVKKIIAPAEEELGTVFNSLVKNALRQMSTDGKIVIRVGPVEFERFFSSGAAAIELDSGVTVNATVMKDLSLEENDLIIDSDEGTVNAGIDSQLEYVKIAFERANQYEPD